jgi:rSAM/selenodomain-associated transferase 2
MPLSIVIPVLNEGEALTTTLDALSSLRALGVEVIVVDGGSRDATIQRARLRANRVITAPRGRASQMNAGAATASWDVVLFLSPGTRLPEAAEHIVINGLKRSGRAWGHFDVKVEGPTPRQRLANWVKNFRSRMTGTATGDQAIFVTRAAFAAAGAYPYLPLMEDIVLSRRLKGHGAPICLHHHVLTSGRRWRKHGVLRTILLMWRLRLAFFLGADPEALAQRYGHASRDN